MDYKNEIERLQTRIANLESTLETRSLIGQAMGMLIERFHIDADTAFATLSRVASHEEVRLSEIAAHLLEYRSFSGDAMGHTEPSDDESAAPGWEAFDLSPRELQILRLVAAGATNLDIAATLYIGINTVKTYIRTSYRKIGVERRSQAVIWAHAHGLVDSRP